MAYQVEGKLIEVCTCDVICPCWAGWDPDGGECDGVMAWQVEKGEVDGVDVSGRSLVILSHIPGNIMNGNWRVRLYVDDEATPEQGEALLNAWTGRLGGPLADLSKLVGEVMGVDRARIRFEPKGVAGRLQVGEAIEADMKALEGATGENIALHDTMFTTVPGAPAYVCQSNPYRVEAPGFKVDLKNHSAVVTRFQFAS